MTTSLPPQPSLELGQFLALYGRARGAAGRLDGCIGGFPCAGPRHRHRLLPAVRRFLAWQSVETDKAALNLNARQRREAAYGGKATEESPSGGPCTKRDAGCFARPARHQWTKRRGGTNGSPPDGRGLKAVRMRNSLRLRADEHLILKRSIVPLKIEIAPHFPVTPTALVLCLSRDRSRLGRSRQGASPTRCFSIFSVSPRQPHDHHGRGATVCWGISSIGFRERPDAALKTKAFQRPDVFLWVQKVPDV